MNQTVTYGGAVRVRSGGEMKIQNMVETGGTGETSNKVNNIDGA